MLIMSGPGTSNWQNRVAMQGFLSTTYCTILYYHSKLQASNHLPELRDTVSGHFELGSKGAEINRELTVERRYPGMKDAAQPCRPAGECAAADTGACEQPVRSGEPHGGSSGAGPPILRKTNVGHMSLHSLLCAVKLPSEANEVVEPGQG